MNVGVKRKIEDPEKYLLNAAKGGTSNDATMVCAALLRVIVLNVDLR